MKKELIASYAVALGLASASSQARASEESFLLTPQVAQKLGLNYQKILAAVTEVKHDQINRELWARYHADNETLDLGSFDQFVVNVPIYRVSDATENRGGL